MTLQLLHSEFLIYEENVVSFLSVYSYILYNTPETVKILALLFGHNAPVPTLTLPSRQQMSKKDE
jgi:hypothetical protein